MSEYARKKDYWTLMVAFAGILVLAGIVSVAGPVMENTNTESSDLSGTGGAGDVGANVVPPVETSEKNSGGGAGDGAGDVLIGTDQDFLDYETIGDWKDYHRVDNLPDAIGKTVGGTFPPGATILTDISVSGTVLSFTVRNTQIVPDDKKEYSETFTNRPVYPLYVGIVIFTEENGELKLGYLTTINHKNDILAGKERKETVDFNPPNRELPPSYRIVAVKIITQRTKYQ